MENTVHQEWGQWILPLHPVMESVETEQDLKEKKIVRQ